MMWTVEHIRIWFAGDTERERDVLLSSTRGSPAGAGQVWKTISKHLFLHNSEIAGPKNIEHIQGGGLQPEPEACVGRKNLGASSQCRRRHYLSQPGCKFFKTPKNILLSATTLFVELSKLSQGNLGEKSSRSPDKQLPRPDSSPDLANHRANGNPPSKTPNSSSSLSNGETFGWYWILEEAIAIVSKNFNSLQIWIF